METINIKRNSGLKTTLQDYGGLIFFILVTFGVSIIASQYEPGLWYQQLAKPTWNPPNWIFPVVWTILYLMMSIAVWLVWRQKGKSKIFYPILMYFIQLTLNGLWSWLFFGEHLIGLALLDILILFISIFITMLLFWKLNKLSGVFFIPYLLWVGFASILNAKLWILN